MTFQGKFTKIAIAAGMTGAMALSATGASAATSKTERAIIGALIGGVAGAAVAKNDTAGVAIGAAAGAALGAATAKDHNYSSRYRTSRPYYSDSRYYGQRYDSRTRYYDPRYDSRYDSRYGYNSYGYRR